MATYKQIIELNNEKKLIIWDAEGKEILYINRLQFT